MEIAPLKLKMPWPPSTNTYWRYVGGRPMISRDGRLFRKRVQLELCLAGLSKLTGRLNVKLEFHPPDRRRRDLDNLQKALLDALQHAGVYEDDSQIDRLELIRRDVRKGGETLIEITEMEF